MHFEIINNSKKRIPRQFVRWWMDEILSSWKKKLKHEYLVLVFMDKAKMKKLNFKYRKKNYATDVLSFASIEESSLGELVICPEVLVRQALEHRLSYREELGYMLIHGFLHLLGYDHEKSKRDAKLMFEIQDKLFEDLCKRYETGKKTSYGKRRSKK